LAAGDAWDIGRLRAVHFGDKKHGPQATPLNGLIQNWHVTLSESTLFMKRSLDAIESSYAFCRQMSRRAGSSFHAGFLLLPREKRRAMEALYAFMRHTDDLADAGCGAGATPAPQETLAAWRVALGRALEGEVACCGADFLLPALADTVRRFRIPHEHLLAVIDGVEMDLTPQRYETFDELERYCEHVASAVGLACICIWGFHGAGAFEPARQTGIALQLTNILRDLKEDAAAGRVYLPLADLRQCGYTQDDLQAGVANDAFHRLMRFEIERAEQFYRGGAELWNYIELDGRRIFSLMTATYWELLKRIERRPAEVLQRRVRVGAITKMRLFASSMFCSRRLAGEFVRRADVQPENAANKFAG
jgi:15-cis-phytoene synthase